MADAHEHGSTAGGAHREIPPIAEALGYIGGALALAAIIALLATFWSKLGIAGHAGISAALAIAGLAGGFAIGRHEGDAAERLAQFLLLAGVAGVGALVGFVVRDVLLKWVLSGGDLFASRTTAAEWGWFAGAAAVALSGGIVWLRRQSVLQHLAFGLGVASAALLVLPLMPVEGPQWGAGAVLVAVGLIWGALSLADKLPPRAEGLVLSALGIEVGIVMMARFGLEQRAWPLWLGAAVSVALIWAGSRLEELPVLGVGTIGLMVFSAQLVGEYLGFGASTAIVLIGIGFVLLGVGVRLTMRLAPDAPLNRRIAAEVAGYLGVALAMGGAGILVAQYWDELGTAGHIIVPVVGASVAYACAALLGKQAHGAARRLSQVLLAIGVLCIGIAGAMIAQPLAERAVGAAHEGQNPADAWAMLAAGLAATAAGAGTWAWRKGALTQVAFMGGLMMCIISGLNFPWVIDNVPDWTFGPAFVVLGVVWIVLGQLERITPVRTALVLGSVAVLQGLQLTMAGEQGFHAWAGFMGVGFGIAWIAASLLLKRAVLLAFGAVYVLVFSVATAMEVFGGRAGAPILLLVLGVVFIAVAVAAAKIAPRIRRAKDSEDAETPSGAEPGAL